MPVHIETNSKSVRCLAFGAEAILRDAIGDRSGEWIVCIFDMTPTPECVITVAGPGGFVFKRRFEGRRQQSLEFIRERIMQALPPSTPPL